ncbi:MAG: hypothetical protein ACFFDW_03305 [Candidatus Thorarchaeota archaeon]
MSDLIEKEIDFLLTLFDQELSLKSANAIFEEKSIKDFFIDENEFRNFIKFLHSKKYLEIDGKKQQISKQWGDVQTPLNLINKIMKILTEKNFSPDIMIEPTFGIGNFILVAKNYFENVQLIYGIEINEEYKWFLGLKLLSTETQKNGNTTIKLISEDIFEHDFQNLLKCNTDKNFLILGNPPWITSSELSHINGNNIPNKKNIRNLPGILALTGKSNFDISETILERLISSFQKNAGKVAILCKNIVIRNILHNLIFTKYTIGNICSYEFDSKKEFGKTCNASLLLLDLNSKEEYGICKVYSLYSPNKIHRKFGWYNNHFVSNLDNYKKTCFLEGTSILEWRQGIKHDCVKILELEKVSNGILKNKLNEEIKLENELIFPYYKSSDIREFFVDKTNRWFLLTQKSLNEDINLERNFPLAAQYLESKKEYFQKRKSSIYQKRSPFAIFGIGKYSFKPFKVAIASMYQQPIFSFIDSTGNKPALFDDTCYYLGFDNYNEAVFICSILNSEINRAFLESIVFYDSQRIYNKEILMRIELEKIIAETSFENVLEIWEKYDFPKVDKITEKDYIEFKNNYLEKRD